MRVLARSPPLQLDGRDSMLLGRVRQGLANGEEGSPRCVRCALIRHITAALAWVTVPAVGARLAAAESQVRAAAGGAATTGKSVADRAAAAAVLSSFPVRDMWLCTDTPPPANTNGVVIQAAIGPAPSPSEAADRACRSRMRFLDAVTPTW